MPKKSKRRKKRKSDPLSEAKALIKKARKKTTTLNLSGLSLTKLPKSIRKLTKLEDLDISNNQLTEFPKSITQLRELQILGLHDNKLTELPESISLLTKLRKLFLLNNHLAVLPESIGRLTQLESLCLDNNKLAELPKSLKDLKALNELFLHVNETLQLPVEVLGPTWSECNNSETKPTKPTKILDFYFRVKRPLNEAKLIVVGRAGVGKTSLVKQLLTSNRRVFDPMFTPNGGVFNPNEPKTEGIEISEWKFSINGKEDITLNIWDFGGQEIMHATHQFFLTKRSLYLLVLTGREEVEDADAEYWLKLIKSYGDESPIIVVLNKISEYAFDINSRSLKAKYPAIRSFIKTDCKDGTNIADLRQTIMRETGNLEHLGDAFPENWFVIRDALVRTKKNYLSFVDYRAICERYGEAKKEAQEGLLGYLHNLGSMLCYKDDPRLQDTHVLNPRWVTTGIYKILNSKLLKEQKGEIWLGNLDTILLPGEGYPSDKHRFICDLMKKFDLCFNFPEDDTHYLIPELLDKEEPKETQKFNPVECLNFQYHYPVLPEGLLPRFIVRTHALSEGSPRWRTGVILKFELCIGLVKADVQDKRVFISISGPTAARRRLLAIIRSNFEHIHRDIRNLQPKEMVPLPNYPDVVVSYDKLMALEHDKFAKTQEYANGRIIELDVQELLNGVELEEIRKKPRTKRDAVRLFYSYSHKDESLRSELETHLTLLKRQGLIEDWHFHQIEAGEKMEEKIYEKLEQAEIILLLVSADFLNSKNCKTEMTRALARHDKNEARVIPVIVRESNWKDEPFSNIQVLPKQGVAVTSWPDKHVAWRDVSEGIARVVNEIRKKQ